MAEAAVDLFARTRRLVRCAIVHLWVLFFRFWRPDLGELPYRPLECLGILVAAKLAGCPYKLRSLTSIIVTICHAASLSMTARACPKGTSVAPTCNSRRFAADHSSVSSYMIRWSMSL